MALVPWPIHTTPTRQRTTPMMPRDHMVDSDQRARHHVGVGDSDVVPV